MGENAPRTGPRHEPERIHERAADPAEAVDKALEDKQSHEPLNPTDDPSRAEPHDAHHRLNTEVGEPDPDADSDPYRRGDSEDGDRASGTEGSGQGAER